MKLCRVILLSVVWLLSFWCLAAADSQSEPQKGSIRQRPVHAPVFNGETTLPSRTHDCLPEPRIESAYERGLHFGRGKLNSEMSATSALFPLMDWPILLDLDDDLCLVAYATIRQTCATRKQTTKPMTSGNNADTVVHLADRVSFQMV